MPRPSAATQLAMHLTSNFLPRSGVWKGLSSSFGFRLEHQALTGKLPTPGLALEGCPTFPFPGEVTGASPLRSLNGSESERTGSGEAAKKKL